MPKQVDHAGRRAEIADALWQVVARDGIEAATVRNVAAQAVVSPGRVQHYFASKEEMLRFALAQVGERFAARISERVQALGTAAVPREVVRTVLVTRLPGDAEQRAYVQALLAWLGQSTKDTEIESSMVEGTRLLRDYLAGQIGRGAPGRGDPSRLAEGMLALTDGLISHVLQGIQGTESATAIIDEYLDLVFDAP